MNTNATLQNITMLFFHKRTLLEMSCLKQSTSYLLKQTYHIRRHAQTAYLGITYITHYFAILD